MRTIIVIILVVYTHFCYGQKRQRHSIDVAVFQGDELRENAFLINGRKGVTLIDALGSSVAATKIIQAIRGKTLSSVFITHAHPHHFMGLATILKEHPEAIVFVANAEIKKDILNYASFALSRGMFDREPMMRPTSGGDGGFDYSAIKVLTSNKLMIGSDDFLLVETIEGTECAHNTILYTQEADVLFASDLLYYKVFNWLASGVDSKGITNWIETLQRLKQRFNQRDILIFPGHGNRADRTVFDVNINYLSVFRDILCRSSSRADAKAFFKKLYPDYSGEFLLTRSIDHWMDSCRHDDHTISIRHIQDLTHTLTSDFPFIPVPGITFPFGIKAIATLEKHGVRANQWTIHEHLGTQIDAPNHFASDGIPLEEIRVEDLIVPVIVVDISDKSASNPDAALTVEDLKQWEKSNGRIPNNACVMMYSGWEKFLFEPKYLGLDKDHVKHFPGISAEAIQFLITERSISGVGVDVISFDPGYDNAYKGHKLLFSANKWALEAVANLKLIPPKGAWLFVGAPKVKDGTGGIVRLLAVWE